MGMAAAAVEAAADVLLLFVVLRCLASEDHLANGQTSSNKLHASLCEKGNPGSISGSIAKTPRRCRIS